MFNRQLLTAGTDACTDAPGTGGDTQVAIDAIKAAGQAHRFLGVTAQGLAAIVHTKGNPHTHIILRGGKTGPNYDAESVAKAAASLEKAGVDPAIMIDCSHANSQKKHKNQPIVAADIAKQLAAGDTKIRGVMVESHLSEGKVNVLPVPLLKLKRRATSNLRLY